MVLVWCADSVAIMVWCGVQGDMVEHGVWWPTVATLVAGVAFYGWVWHLAEKLRTPRIRQERSDAAERRGTTLAPHDVQHP